MYSVGSIFGSPESACVAVQRLLARGVPRDRVSLLMPGTSAPEAERELPLDDGEPQGMGAALGSVVGGALGLATASLVFPGIGPIIVGGVLAGGLIGAAGGSAAGSELEAALSAGLPRDRLSIYTEALRHGGAVVIAEADTRERADDLREVFRESLAERIDL